MTKQRDCKACLMMRKNWQVVLNGQLGQGMGTAFAALILIGQLASGAFLDLLGALP